MKIIEFDRWSHLTLESLADWNEFWEVNRNDILDKYDDVTEALGALDESDFRLGGGASPQFVVIATKNAMREIATDFAERALWTHAKAMLNETGEGPRQ